MSHPNLKSQAPFAPLYIRLIAHQAYHRIFGLYNIHIVLFRNCCIHYTEYEEYYFFLRSMSIQALLYQILLIRRQSCFLCFERFCNLNTQFPLFILHHIPCKFFHQNTNRYLSRYGRSFRNLVRICRHMLLYQALCHHFLSCGHNHIY